MAPKLKEGMYVWVKDTSIAGTDVYTKGHILNINGNKVTVETSNDVKTQELIIPTAECYMINPGKDVRSAHLPAQRLARPLLALRLTLALSLARAAGGACERPVTAPRARAARLPHIPTLAGAGPLPNDAPESADAAREHSAALPNGVPPPAPRRPARPRPPLQCVWCSCHCARRRRWVAGGG